MGLPRKQFPQKVSGTDTNGTGNHHFDHVLCPLIPDQLPNQTEKAQEDLGAPRTENSDIEEVLLGAPVPVAAW